MLLACAYHWYMVGLYASPVILLGGWVWLSGRRHRRRGNGGEPPEAGTPATSAG